jgi:acyl transferase domain-containing protein
VDTACSSSIYALHLACNSLLAGDCTAALVGGINLIIGPYTQLDVAKLGVLSPTSTCHTFDFATDGYARAEGCGVLYIKLLKDAVKDKNPIRAVIRGTAANR